MNKMIPALPVTLLLTLLGCDPMAPSNPRELEMVDKDGLYTPFG